MMANSFLGATGLVLSLLIGIALMPTAAHAAPSSKAFLGGGNALSRAVSSESQGLTSANSTSNLLGHLTFASTRGGRQEEVPPAHANDENGGIGDASEGSKQVADPASPSDASDSAQTHGNGGSQGGSGGNGGAAANGGLVQAGSVVTNSNAVNAINTTIVRISLR